MLNTPAYIAEIADKKQAAMDATEAILLKNQSAMRFGTVDRWETMFPSGPLKNAQLRTLRAKAATGTFMDRWGYSSVNSTPYLFASDSALVVPSTVLPALFPHDVVLLAVKRS